jgi:hypothetical protein
VLTAIRSPLKLAKAGVAAIILNLFPVENEVSCENVLRLAARRDLKNRNPPGRNGQYYCNKGVMDIRSPSEHNVHVV